MIQAKQYISDLMNDRRNDPVSCTVKLLLCLISHFYGLFARCHHALYNAHLLRSYKPLCPVFSVGNITLGGTGKTPFVIALSKILSREKKKSAVLIRGYGEDEWKLLSDRIAVYDSSVFVGRDRVRTARQALERGVYTIVLDDGFQHRRLARDLDIVLLDSTNPFGNRHLFPRGILREPITHIRRADIIILTKVDKADRSLSSLEDEVRKIAPGTQIGKALHEPKGLYDIRTAAEYELSFIRGKKVCAFSAICDPSYFRHTIEKTGATVGLECVFPDHYSYTIEDCNGVFDKCRKRTIGLAITTEKDAVKLKALPWSVRDIQVLVLKIDLVIVEGERALDARLYSLHSRSHS